MPIIKRVKDKFNFNNGQDIDITQPSISYTNDGLADVIVQLWANPQNILDRVTINPVVPTPQAVAQATVLINANTGLNLKSAVILTEEEHDSTNYVTQDVDEVVFVLPNKSRVGTNSAPHQLLETARLLMACTPHGI
jgi:hypothetical protein